MNMRLFNLSAGLALMLALLFSCDGKSDIATEACGINNPKDGTRFDRGEFIPISIVTGDTNKKITRCEIYLDETLSAFSDTEPWEWDLMTDYMVIGEHLITALITLDGNTLIRDSVTIRLTDPIEIITFEATGIIKNSALIACRQHANSIRYVKDE